MEIASRTPTHPSLACSNKSHPFQNYGTYDAGLGNLGQDLVSLGRGRLEEAVWAFLRVGQPDHATQCGLALVTLKAGTVQVRLLVGTNVFFNAYNIDLRGDACRIASFPSPSIPSLIPLSHLYHLQVSSRTPTARTPPPLTSWRTTRNTRRPYWWLWRCCSTSFS